MKSSKTVAVIDFETTGISPATGAKPTEIAIVLVEKNLVVDRFQSLMNPGTWIPSHIEKFTGISNPMVAAAPSVENVMKQAFLFCKTTKIVAHNASFDKKFWQVEKEKIQSPSSIEDQFLCTVLLARRVYKSCPNHKLSTLATYLNLKANSSFHRAAVDAEVTAQLYIKICNNLDISGTFGAIDYDKLLTLQKSKNKYR